MTPVYSIQDSETYPNRPAFFDRIIGTGPVNWPVLAFTRFMLAFIVVAAHTVEYTNQPGPLRWINLFNAFNAIMGFLLISGLSIGKSILHNEQSYFSRRAKRIYPVYIVSIVLRYLIMPEPLTVNFIGIILVNIFFLNQFLTATSYVGPAWTLALEVWLYSLAPFFLKLSYKTLLTITSLSLLSYCLYTCGRSLFDWPYYSGISYGFNLLFLSFIWIIGFTLAIFPAKVKEISLLIGAIFIVHFGLTSCLSIGYRLKHHQIDMLITKDTVTFLFEFVCLVLIYYLVIANRNLPKLSSNTRALFNFLGNISYPLYLTHTSVLECCKKVQITNWLALLSCCLVISSIIYWLFDFYSKSRLSQ